MSSRFIAVRDALETTVAIAAGRQVSSAPSGWSPQAPAQTLLRYPQHKTPANPRFHKGAIAPHVPVQLLFWGDFWRGAGAAQQADVQAQVQELLAGPYWSALDQYGIAPPVFGGARIVRAPAPPSDPIDGGDASSMVWDLIGDDVFPEPDDPGGRNAYMVLLPPGVKTASGAPGAHASRFHLELPADVDWAWVAWCRHDTDTSKILAIFSHELVELVTDPEPGGGWFDDTLEHREGELSDLCQPGRIWQTAFVGNVKTMAYWSVRDQACVIPTHPLAVRLDGRIVVNRRLPDGSGSQEHPFGESPRLCALLPRCCFRGPYDWTRTRVIETASLHATTSGYHAASLAWTIGGMPVSGSSTIDVTTGVTRDTPTGPTFSEETVTLRFAQSGNGLKVTNDAVAGSFEVTVTVVADESDASGALDGRRRASVVLPFHGLDLAWDPQLANDQQACADATQALWVREHRQRAVTIRLIDPGPLHTADTAVLLSLGAAVTEKQRRAGKVALWHAQLLRERHPVEAAHLRHSLLAGLGIVSAPSRDESYG